MKSFTYNIQLNSTDYLVLVDYISPAQSVSDLNSNVFYNREETHIAPIPIWERKSKYDFLKLESNAVRRWAAWQAAVDDRPPRRPVFWHK